MSLWVRTEGTEQPKSRRCRAPLDDSAITLTADDASFVSLPFFHNPPTKPNRLVKGCAVLLAALVLLLVVLEVCPAAHEWFHHDADHEDHDCVVTLFAHGIVTALTAVALVLVSWRLIGCTVPLVREFLLPHQPCWLPQSQAPPVG